MNDTFRNENKNYAWFLYSFQSSDGANRAKLVFTSIYCLIGKFSKMSILNTPVIQTQIQF